MVVLDLRLVRGTQAEDPPEWDDFPFRGVHPSHSPVSLQQSPTPGWEISLPLKELRQAEDPALTNATTSYTLSVGILSSRSRGRDLEDG